MQQVICTAYKLQINTPSREVQSSMRSEVVLQEWHAMCVVAA
jgi:hypothetical protein